MSWPVDIETESKWKTWYPSTDNGKGNSPSEDVDDIQETYLPHNKFEPTRRIINQGDDEVDYGNGSESGESNSESHEPQLKEEPEVRATAKSKAKARPEAQHAKSKAQSKSRPKPEPQPKDEDSYTYYSDVEEVEELGPLTLQQYSGRRTIWL